MAVTVGPVGRRHARRRGVAAWLAAADGGVLVAAHRRCPVAERVRWPRLARVSPAALAGRDQLRRLPRPLAGDRHGRPPDRLPLDGPRPSPIVAISLALAQLSAVVVEHPIRRRRIVGRPLAVAAAATLAIVAVTAVVDGRATRSAALLGGLSAEAAGGDAGRARRLAAPAAAGRHVRRLGRSLAAARPRRHGGRRRSSNARRRRSTSGAGSPCRHRRRPISPGLATTRPGASPPRQRPTVPTRR